VENILQVRSNTFILLFVSIYTRVSFVITSSNLCLLSHLCSEVFCSSNNNTLKENEIIRFPKLALTYKQIAEEGPDAFYNGSLTQTILDDIDAAGYFMLKFDSYLQDLVT